ncbi:MAG: right-handed parallel beta-helix repeat-containing protein [bacterium]|nr:right-handed parallel beta-helix repeat-containing protein [bacterium]
MKKLNVFKMVMVVLATLAVLGTAMVGTGYALSVTSPINAIDTWDATPRLTWYWNGPDTAAQFIVQVDERNDFLYPLEFEVNLRFDGAGQYGLSGPGFGGLGTYSFNIPDTLALDCVPEGEITRYYWRVIVDEDTKSNLGWFDIVPPSLQYPLNGFDVYSATPDLVFGANENITGDTDVVDSWAIWVDKDPGFVQRAEFNPDGSLESWPKIVNTADSQALRGLNPTTGLYAIDTDSFNLKNGTYYWRVMGYQYDGTNLKPYTNWSTTWSFTIRPVDLRSLTDGITTNSPQPTFCWDARVGIPYEGVLNAIAGGTANTGGSDQGDSYIFQFGWFNNDNFEDQNEREGWGVDTAAINTANLLIQARIPGNRTCFTIGDTYPLLVYDVLNANVFSALNAGRLPEGTYWWRIMSVNANSWSDSTNWSVKWRAIVDLEDCVPPEAPILQQPGNCQTDGTNGGDRTTDNTPTFTWTDVSDPSGSQPSDLWYEIQIDHDGSFSIADSEDVEYDLWIRTAAGTAVSNFTFGSATNVYLSDRTTPWPAGATLPDGIWFWRVRAHDPTCNWVVGNWSEVCYFTVDTTAPKARLIYPGAKAEFCSRQFHINDCTPTLEWVDLPPYGVSPNGLDEPPAVTYDVRIIRRNAGVYAGNPVNLPGSTNGWVDVGTKHSFITTVCLQDSDTDGDFYWWELRVTDDAGNTWSDSFAFIVDTRAPTTPQTLSDTPVNGAYWTDPTPTFIWDEGDTHSQTRWVDWSATAATYLSSTSDGNPPETYAWVISHGTELRYDLQIAPMELGWNSAVVDVTELTQPTYTAALADGNYMWRVRARDCAGNYSPWKTQVFVIDTIPPCTPELLSPSNGIAISDTTPLFDWADVIDPNIISYHIEVDSSPATPLTLDINYWNTGTPPVSQYQTKDAEALDNRVIYYWRVTAYDKAGNQCASQVWSFNPEMAAPADPTLLAPFGCVSYRDEGYKVEPDISPSVFGGTGGALSRAFSRTRPTFYWEDTDTQQRTISYIFELTKGKDAGDPDFIDPDISVSGLTQSQYTLPPAYTLTEGHYYWRVIAVSDAGNLSNGANMMVFTVDLTPPDMPNYSSPDDAIIFNDDSPTLDWDEPEPYDLRYQLQIDDDGDFSSPILDINDFESQLVGGQDPLGAGTTGYIHGSQYTVTPAMPEGTYYWRVRAMDCAGNISDWSHTSPYRRFTIDTTAPDAPNLVSPADWHITNDITPTMTWNQVVDSKSYHASELSGNFINSDYCSEIYYLIQIEVAGSLSGDHTGDVFTQTVEYSNDPRDPYDVYHPEMFQTLDGRMTFTPTILPGIGAGKTFYWRVTAIDCAENESTWSEIRAIRIDPQMGSCPTLVSPDNGTYTNDPTPFFDWSDEGSAYGDEGTGPSIDKLTYQIQVDNNVDFASPEIDEWVNVSSYVPTIALRDGTYYWRIGGKDEAGNRCCKTGWSTDVWEIHIDTRITDCFVSCKSVRLVTPAADQCINDATPIFDWDPIGDPSAPIVYTLQVSDDIKFSDPLEINISELPFEPLMEFRTNGVPSIQNIANTRWPIDQDGDGRFNITEADYKAYNGQFGGRFDGKLAGLNAFPEGTYYWRVKAFDQATNSTNWSTPNKFEVDLQPPAVPTLIRPAKVSQVVNDKTPSPVTESTPTFEWTTALDGKTTHYATHYIFQMDRDSDFSSPEVDVKVKDQGKSTVKYILPNEYAMIMGEIYYWRVAAVDCGGNRSAFTGAWSLKKSATFVNRILDNVPPYDDRIYQEDIVWNLSNSPYIIEDLVQVQPGVTLTVQPGVEVLFRPFSTLTDGNQPPELIIQGTLVAAGRAPSSEGTIPEMRITFSTWTRPDGQVYYPKAGDWGRIKFEETSQNSKISYADISYGGWYEDGLGEYHRGNIEVYGTNVVIDHITSTNSRAYGILYSGPKTARMTNDPTKAMNPTLTNSEFTDNQLDGADFKIDDGTITIDNCEFARNGRWGILNEGNYYVGNHTDLVVTNCDIHDNGLRPTDVDGVGGGIYSTCTGSETITDNIIQNNEGWAVIKGQNRLGNCVGGYVINKNLIKGNGHNAIWIDATNHCTDTVWYANYAVKGTSWNYDDLVPYFVQRVIVEEGVTLTVKPGVVVKFDETKPKSEGAGLEIRGKLIADGDPGGNLHAFEIIEPGKACCPPFNRSIVPDGWTKNFIVFTSYFDDNYGGNTNCDGQSEARIADDGDWQGIVFRNSSLDDSIINRSIILYSEDAVELHSASPTITSNKIAYNAYRAIAVRENSDPLIEWNHLTENDSYSPDDDSTYTEDATGHIAGTIATFCWEEAEPIIRHNLINYNRNYAIGITANNAYLITDNEIFGNWYNAIKVCGDITTPVGTAAVGAGPALAPTIQETPSVTWHETDAPFYIPDGLTVTNGAFWSIDPGITIKVRGNIYINGSSKIKAAGTIGEGRIIFTSYRDDNYGGDTNVDEDYMKAAIGDWGGIAFNDATTSGELEEVVIKYAAVGVDCAANAPTIKRASIVQNGIGVKCTLGASPSITQSVFSKNTQYGIYTSTGSNPLIGGSEEDMNEFLNNADGGVYNTDESILINAKYNWWGDATGPADKSKTRPYYNLNGLGDRVSDYVDYKPWSKEGHTPVADAGHDMTVESNITVILDGSKSYDLDENDVLAYVWTQTAGPETVVLHQVEHPTFVPNYAGDYTFQLVIVDSTGKTSNPDAVTIHVVNSTTQVKLRFGQEVYEKRPGETFELNVYVGDDFHKAKDIYGVAFTLNFTRSDILDYVSAAPGKFLDPDPQKLVLIENHENVAKVDEGAGKIEIGISRKQGIHGTGVTGYDDGKALVKITFKLAEEPDCKAGDMIDFSFSDVEVRNSAKEVVGVKMTDAQIKVIAGNIYNLVIWPGDTNNDAYVDAKDILPIGMYWKVTGAPRPSATTQWVGQSMLGWSTTAATYADANGDGVVDAKDVLAVGLNWHRSHTVVSAAPVVTGGEAIDYSAYLEAFRAMYEALGDGNSELKQVLADYISRGMQSFIPAKTALGQNYPNPLNPETFLPFSLSHEVEVAINIFDLSGRLVRSFDLGVLPAGGYTSKDRAAYWDGKDSNGQEVSSGIYFYQLKAGSFETTRKMIVLK